MIQVIKRAFDILELVSKSDSPSSLTEIATKINLNQATCANILKTLTDMHYLEHMGRKKGYRLGPMAYQLTGNLAYNQNLLQAAKAEMESLVNRINETCILGILRNQKRFIVHTVNSDQDLQVRSRSERDVYETASGRVLMAFLPDKEREGLISSIGLPKPDVWKGVKTRKQLDDELERIRKDRIATTLSSSHIIGLAVPISKSNNVIASLSVFLPESRYSGKAQMIEKALKETASQIIKQLEIL